MLFMIDESRLPIFTVFVTERKNRILYLQRDNKNRCEFLVKY
jgi:hypothetical protein